MDTLNTLVKLSDYKASFRHPNPICIVLAGIYIKGNVVKKHIPIQHVLLIIRDRALGKLSTLGGQPLGSR